jgi:signal peptidase I
MHALDMPRTTTTELPVWGTFGALIPLSFIAALMAAFATIVFSAAQPFYVEGSSMSPSLGNGQILVVNRAAAWRVDGTPIAHLLPDSESAGPLYLFGGPRHGDIVVFQSPMTTEDSAYVKRVIGLPGDSVLVKAGRVFVNGEALDEAYVKFQDDYTYPTDGAPLRVPDGEYFVLGDNRGASVDSHMGWFVPADNLLGPAVALPWKLS